MSTACIVLYIVFVVIAFLLLVYPRPFIKKTKSESKSKPSTPTEN